MGEKVRLVGGETKGKESTGLSSININNKAEQDKFVFDCLCRLPHVLNVYEYAALDDNVFFARCGFFKCTYLVFGWILERCLVWWFAVRL